MKKSFFWIFNTMFFCLISCIVGISYINYMLRNDIDVVNKYDNKVSINKSRYDKLDSVNKLIIDEEKKDNDYNNEISKYLEDIDSINDRINSYVK